MSAATAASLVAHAPAPMAVPPQPTSLELNHLPTFRGRNVGPCTECQCRAYTPRSHLGGLCMNCNHPPTKHLRLCDMCKKPVDDTTKDCQILCCLDILCSECSHRLSSLPEIDCPRCHCITVMQSAEAAPAAPAEPQRERTLQERFEQAAVDVALLSKRPNDQTQLELYGFFKQAKEGDCTTKKPGMFDVRARYKWDAWNKHLGMTKEAAMEAYIALVEELKRK
ncbi:putative acyl-CoA-binding protein [Paratrimastix pyriformis]|uniref:Acyl-CoA-binding protein n=1 Tax=Paratrimastix pyriformis TaxID=342808 RepID=A0ABQ8U9A5_9EUKA|nr:putative acyl-CoA-binding protein [Paratrimastix pyriformis]|eukprot:GAFH01002904.1.p1 GENE.GAFH01002904.1~~GAFH01002904.1.p1  ORF type:complete len:224 (-),score=46.43 GAFH01002904.1:307-978(-)